MKKQDAIDVIEGLNLFRQEFEKHAVATQMVDSNSLSDFMGWLARQVDILSDNK